MHRATLQLSTFFMNNGATSFNFFQQVFYVAKARRQLQKSTTSISGEMNAGLSYFSEDVQISAEIS
ncbi:hypothetical protein [Lysinibacillus sp. JNUCC 51]|uniref:hypothetical protein n=1 Tax=Lysinibacillus sp. JNUCC-51 TaxID=2792479 RepID=UPI001935C7AC|nr:hypothetical protein JNUCC51_08625 [Lysinibacillus sp. JNUCC-51]